MTSLYHDAKREATQARLDSLLAAGTLKDKRAATPLLLTWIGHGWTTWYKPLKFRRTPR